MQVIWFFPLNIFSYSCKLDSNDKRKVRGQYLTKVLFDSFNKVFQQLCDKFQINAPNLTCHWQWH